MQRLTLSIPEPCHEQWDNMQPNEQGRFCNSCAKTVVDFTNMSDAELLGYFAGIKHNNTCGRVYPDQLNRGIQPAEPPRRKIFQYWQYLVALFMMMGKGQQSKAQATAIAIEGKTDSISQIGYDRLNEVVVVGFTTRVSKKKTATLKEFQVADPGGNPIPGASVAFSKGNYAVANNEGKVKLSKKQGRETVSISAIGFKQKTINIQDIEHAVVTLDEDISVLPDIMVNADLSLRGATRITLGGMGASYARVSHFKDTLFNIKNFVAPALKVYPNPVQRGGSVRVSVSLKKTRFFNLKFMDAAGKMMLTKQYQYYDKFPAQEINIPSAWSSGLYFLVVTDEWGRLAGEQKIVVR